MCETSKIPAEFLTMLCSAIIPEYLTCIESVQLNGFVWDDDEVIVFEPAYDSYLPAILLNKGVPVFIKMKYPDYSIDWNEVSDAVNQKTKLIIINSPHNPTGMILQKAYDFSNAKRKAV